MEEATDLKKRIAYLRKQLPEKPHLYAHLADCYIHQGKIKKAQKLLTEWLEKMPNVPTGWLVNGALHYQLYHPKQAYAAYKQALRVDEDIALAHEKCAEFAKEEEDSDHYIHHLRELNKLDTFEDTIQKKLQAALLRQAALEHGLYSKEAVEQTIPAVLRKTLLMHNLLPPEVERMRERMPYEEFEDREETRETIPEVIVLGADDGGFDGFDLPKGRPGRDRSPEEKDPHELDDDELKKLAEELVIKSEKPFASIDVPPDQLKTKEEDIETGQEEAELSTQAESEEQQESEEDEKDAVTGDDGEPFESPLMKMLRGEIEEKPASREVQFLNDDELNKPEEPVVETGTGLESATDSPDVTEATPPAAAEPEVKQDLFNALSEETKASPETAEGENEAGDYGDSEIKSELFESFGDAITDSDELSEEPVVKEEPTSSRNDARRRVAEIASSITRNFDNDDDVSESAEEPEPAIPQPAPEVEKADLDIPQPIPEAAKPELDIPQPVDDLVKPELDIPQPVMEDAKPETDFLQSIDEISEPLKDYDTPQSMEEPPVEPEIAEPEKPEPEPDAPQTPPVPTKTLAELYASQGEWEKAVDVYNELLVKFPDNSAYKMRLAELKRRLDS